MNEPNHAGLETKIAKAPLNDAASRLVGGAAWSAKTFRK